MSDKKITHISGMAHLLNEAHPQKPQEKDLPKQQPFPKGKCLKLRCLLDTTDYYIENGECGVSNEPPYFPWLIPAGYSAVYEPGTTKLLAITKHVEKRFYQTGISTEVVDCPIWWERRNDGL